jgi:hypothetical protein
MALLLVFESMFYGYGVSGSMSREYGAKFVFLIHIQGFMETNARFSLRVRMDMSMFFDFRAMFFVYVVCEDMF